MGTFIGDGGNNTLNATVGADSLSGLGGDDSLVGGGGNDTLRGGPGNDTLDGGTQLDRADYSTETTNIYADLAAGSATGAGNDVFLNIENVTGGTGDDTLLGDGGGNSLNGSAGNDSLVGGDGNDTLIGGAGNDTLDGSASIYDIASYTTDTAGVVVDLAAGTATGTLSGTDIFVNIERADGGSASDTLSGNSEDNILRGFDGNDSLVGAGGNDSLDGLLGADSLLGGSGNDTYGVDNPGDIVGENFNEGIDSVYTTLNSYLLSDNLENLSFSGVGSFVGTGNGAANNLGIGVAGSSCTLDGGEGADTIFANDGNDSLIGGGGNDLLIGYLGNDTVSGGAGNDQLGDDSGNDVAYGGDGNDFVTDGAGNDLFFGEADNDSFLGYLGSGDDTVSGGEGDDTLWGGVGNDSIQGDGGNDSLSSDDGSDTLAGGTGNDTFVCGFSSLSNPASLATDHIVDFDSSDELQIRLNSANIKFIGTAAFSHMAGETRYSFLDPDTIIQIDINGDGTADQTIVLDNIHATLAKPFSYKDSLYLGGASDQTIAGDGGNNSLVGNTGNDSVDGAAGNDSLFGSDGNDTLVGGNGNDTIDGAAGIDTARYTSARVDYTIFWNGAGFTIIDTRVGSPDGTDLVESIENFQFSDGSRGSGNLINVAPALPVDSDPMSNAVAENAVSGSAVGITASSTDANGDTLTYSLIDDAGGRFAINSSTGVVTVANGTLLDYEAATSHNITVLVSDGALTNSQTFTITVTNVVGATINGNSSANVIDGTHTIAGQALPTGEEDSIDGASGNDTIKALGGNDTITGGAGSDSMIGGLGNDLYIVDASGDKLLENANEGTDSVQSSVSYTLPGNFEALILTGVANLNGTGNSGDNSLTGNSGNNVLAGLGGADVLDGGAGIDTATYAASSLGVDVSLATGTGSGGDAAGDTLNNIENLTGSNFNDTFEGDGTDNVLTGGNGTDTLSYQHAGAGVTVNLSLTSAQNTGGAGVDTVTKFENLTGSAFNDSLIGSTANNVLMGLAGNDTLSDNGGNDTLDGGTGADLMAGGGSNDVYVVDNVGDVVTESSGGGTDTIQTALNTYSLALIANVENLNFVGAGGFTGTGNGLNNALTGGSGNDTLDGGTGNDTLDGGAGADSMIGGAGNDTFIVDAGDTVSEAANGGTDAVKTALTNYTLGAELENLTFTGASNFAGTGNTLANTITGGSANDTLDGGAGNDKLIAGAGDDQLVGSAGNDNLTGGAGADTLTGGVGADKFVFTTLSDFASGPNFDTIADFTHAQADKIDLSAINGNASVAGSAFSFIGAAAFSNVAGQLHYFANGSGGVNVEGDTNGDGVADFTLVVNGVASLAGTDFVL